MQTHFGHTAENFHADETRVPLKKRILRAINRGTLPREFSVSDVRCALHDHNCSQPNMYRVLQALDQAGVVEAVLVPGDGPGRPWVYRYDRRVVEFKEAVTA
jgi:hypothetical protein